MARLVVTSQGRLLVTARPKRLRVAAYGQFSVWNHQHMQLVGDCGQTNHLQSRSVGNLHLQITIKAQRAVICGRQRRQTAVVNPFSDFNHQ
jgi:hypothetical protein